MLARYRGNAIPRSDTKVLKYVTLCFPSSVDDGGIADPVRLVSGVKPASLRRAAPAGRVRPSRSGAPARSEPQ